jgi:hypothetical protein
MSPHSMGIDPGFGSSELYQKLKEKDDNIRVCFLTAVSEFKSYEQYKKDVFPKRHERYFVGKPISENDKRKSK